MIENMSREELLNLINKAENRIVDIDKEEAKKEGANILLAIGKSYRSRSGDTVVIVSRNISVYTGINKSYEGKNMNEKHPEYYIDGRRKKNKISDGDLIEEVVNG